MCSVMMATLVRETVYGVDFVSDWATAASRTDLKCGTRRNKPRCRGPEPLILAARTPTDEPEHLDSLSLALYENFLILECGRDVLSATAGIGALELPDSAEFHASLDTCLREHVRDRPSPGAGSKSRSGASSRATFRVGKTPSRPSKTSPKKKGRASDDKEDGEGRKNRVGGGKRQEANAQYACPFYIFDKHEHFHCRGAVLRGPADVAHHIGRRHEEPELFCSRCWEVFELGDRHHQLAAHNQCDERPFPHHWAREQDLDAVQAARRPGIGPDATWFAMYYAIFSSYPYPRRWPSFSNAFAQDVVDLLSDYRGSLNYQYLAHTMGHAYLHDVWQLASESLVGYLRAGGQFLPRSAQGFDEDLIGSAPGSIAPIQQPTSPHPAQTGSSGANPGSPSVDNRSFGTFDSFQEPFPFLDQDLVLESVFPSSQTMHSQSTGHAAASARLPRHHLSGHVNPPAHSPETPFHTLRDEPLHTDISPVSHATAESFGQGFTVADFTPSPLSQPNVAWQLCMTAQGPQSEPRIVPTDLDIDLLDPLLASSWDRP